MATVFSGLIFMLEFSNLKFGNFHLKRKKFSSVRTNSDSFKGKCELFCVFLCNFYWAVMKWIHFIVKCYNLALLISNYTWTELSFVISLSKNVLSVLHNGNWIEWSAVWSEIICMTLKLDMRAVQVWFEITSMSSDQNLATWSSITTLLEPFWNHKIQSVPILCWSSSKLDDLLKRGVGNTSTSHKQKWCNLEYEWCDLEQMWFRVKIVWFVIKSHCWEPITLQGSVVISNWM